MRRSCGRSGPPPHREAIETPRPRSPEPVRISRSPSSYSGNSGGGSAGGSLLLAFLSFIVIILPFMPVVMIGATVRSVIGGGVGLVAGWAAGLAVLVALYKFRHFRAAYCFLYASFLQASVFLNLHFRGSTMFGAVLAFVLGALLYRGCFEAWRWRAEPGPRGEAGRVSLISALTVLCGSYLLAHTLPGTALFIAERLAGHIDVAPTSD